MPLVGTRGSASGSVPFKKPGDVYDIDAHYGLGTEGPNVPALVCHVQTHAVFPLKRFFVMVYSDLKSNPSL